jgi:hypothetical protein
LQKHNYSNRFFSAGISATPQTATVADYTDIAAAEMVTFTAVATSVTYQITLTPDALCEGIEYFEVVIATVGGTDAAKGAVDTDRDTARVFILDHSCKSRNLAFFKLCTLFIIHL